MSGSIWTASEINTRRSAMKELMKSTPMKTKKQVYLHQKTKCGIAGGLDNIPPDVIKFSGPERPPKLTAFYAHCWENSFIPSDRKDASIVHLYKWKGDKSLCDNRQGISLLNIAEKVFTKLILNRFTTDIIDDIVPESQRGQRPERWTAPHDIIYPATPGELPWTTARSVHHLPWPDKSIWHWVLKGCGECYQELFSLQIGNDQIIPWR